MGPEEQGCGKVWEGCGTEQRTVGDHWGFSQNPWKLGGQIRYSPSTFNAPGAEVEGDLWLGCHKGYCVSEKGRGIKCVQRSCPELGEVG